MNKHAKNTLHYLPFAFLCTLCIFSVSILFSLHFRPLYYFDIHFLDIPKQSGYSSEVIRKNYDELIDYNSILGSDMLSFSDFSMSEEGRIHFDEVKRIFVVIEIAAVLLLPISVLLILLQLRRKNAAFFLLLAALPSALVLLVGALVALNWDFCFVLFHKILFRNDYWIFNPARDPVITILPDTYFLHAAVLILFCVLLAGILSFLCFCFLKRKTLPVSSNNGRR